MTWMLMNSWTTACLFQRMKSTFVAERMNNRSYHCHHDQNVVAMHTAWRIYISILSEMRICIHIWGYNRVFYRILFLQPYYYSNLQNVQKEGIVHCEASKLLLRHNRETSPQSAANAQSIFQQFMDMLQSSARWQFAYTGRCLTQWYSGSIN